jgi:hypothetical protein
LGGAALLFLATPRRGLLCAAAFEAQGQGGSEDGDAGQKFQTWVFPNHFLTFKRSRSPKTPNQNGRCHDLSAPPDDCPQPKGLEAHKAEQPLGLALGYQRGWSRSLTDRIFTDRGFPDGAFARPFANGRGLDNRLRMRQVRSNGCSHESQRRSASDNEFQHARSPCN